MSPASNALAPSLVSGATAQIWRIMGPSGRDLSERTKGLCANGEASATDTKWSIRHSHLSQSATDTKWSIRHSHLSQSATDTKWNIRHSHLSQSATDTKWNIRHSHLSQSATTPQEMAPPLNGRKEDSEDSDFQLAPGVVVREEEFGCTVVLHPCVYALNREGFRLLELATRVSVERIPELDATITEESLFSFVGELCSVGIVTPKVA